tara:strand:- start:221 stop:661 length:441 start_codon:yes stop_codon:yes gene_type:complete
VIKVGWKMILKEREVFYHATDYKNLASIMSKGIVPNYDGIYSSEDGQLSTMWICMTKHQTKKVMVIPYIADTKTHRPATDHSPYMLEMLGAKLDETPYTMDTKVYQTFETIKPEQIRFDKIRVVDNPCYNPELARQFDRMHGREEE